MLVDDNTQKEIPFMKVMNIENPEEFLKVIDSCEGQVELVTADGDRLNLKSKLCQLISLTTVSHPAQASQRWKSLHMKQKT